MFYSPSANQKQLMSQRGKYMCIKLDTRRHQEETPISEANYNQDTVQRGDIPQMRTLINQEAAQLKQMKDQLLKAIMFCQQWIQDSIEQETKARLTELMRILEEGFEQPQIQHYQGIDVDAFDGSSQEVSQSGTPTNPQAYILQNIHQLSYLTEQAVEMCSKEVNEPSCKYSIQLLVREEEQEYRSSEQFRASGQTQERKFHQQQQQIQSQMSGNEEAQFSLNALESQDILNNHKQLKAKYKLKLQKICNDYKSTLKYIPEFRNELASFKNKLKQKIIFEIDSDQLKKFVESQLETKNKTIQSLQKKCAELSENLSASQKQESDSQLKQENKKLNGQIKEITQKIQSLEKELEKRKSANIVLQNKLQEAETEIKDKSEYIQVIEQEFESEKKTLQNQVVQLQRENQVNQLQDKSITQILDEQGQKQSQILQQQQKAGAQLDQFPTLNEKLDYLQKSINGDYLREIKELKDQYAVLRNENEQLKQQVIKLKQDIQKNDQVAILNEKKKELEQKNQLILEQTEQLSQKASEIEGFKKRLSGIGEFVEQQNYNRKMQYEEEHEQILAIHLEGYFKLQEKSILFIFVGLKIYKQYLNSESRDIKNVEKALEDLTKYHTNFQKKDNFIQKDKRTLKKYYNDCLNDLNVLYESTLQSFKNLINELKQRNNEI